ncbi:hypothetical protein QJS10_CPB22g00832 [Acorus calamus]|uniref:Late embryogenesis abundant protein LEA-2 subgroup domain-containing protein n=1 Tax=Acorus calamus TaxID=4465 RepID=A0AAV9C0Z0_ACOCL|nr:hypothetical protein QJS10_CPB22g00832 [Acorus calamus]
MCEKLFKITDVIMVAAVIALAIASIISLSWDSPRFDVVGIHINELNLTSTTVVPPKIDIDISITNPNIMRGVSIHPMNSKSSTNGNIVLFHNANRLGSGFMSEVLHLSRHSTSTVRVTFEGDGYTQWKENLLASADDKGRYTFNVVLYMPVSANMDMYGYWGVIKRQCWVVVEKPTTDDSKIVWESCMSVTDDY